MHRSVAKAVEEYAGDKRFRPPLLELVAAIERDPKAFGKKVGQLKDCRAANVRFAGMAWRLVFEIDERMRTVRILAFDSHDRAYAQAARRTRRR